MDVHVQRRFVMPAPPTQPSSEVPFTVFDLVAPTYHVTVLYAFSAPNPTNAALLDALAATLPRFPLLTARIERHGRPFFVTGRGGAGALVIEASVQASALADHLPLAPSSPELARLHPPPDNGTPHLLRIQVTRFACGGLVVACSSHHQAADGHAMSTFLNAWADAVRASSNAAPIDRPVVPHGPGALVPRRPPRCEFQHRGAEFEACGGASSRKPERVRVGKRSEISNVLLHFPSESVARLKATLENKYTAFEAITAHLWRKITVARGQAEEDNAHTTTLDVSVNGRARLGPDSLPREGFFGNLVLTATSTASAGDLVARGSLADAAALVRAPVRAVDGRYFQSFIDFGELHLHGDEEELEPVMGGDCVVSSENWMHLDLDKLDFGCGGRLVGIVPARVPLDGVLILMPNLQEAGGVDVFVALCEEHAEELRKIAYNMD